MRLSVFRDPRPDREGVFLFTTDHQERTRIFRTPADFTYGVNTLAIGTLRHPIRVLCYALMDNHLHLLLSGRYEECLTYFRWVLQRIAMMLKTRYGISGILKVDSTDVQVVTDAKMLLNEVAYLLRNPYKARIDSPYSYPWVPFEVYFNPYLPLMHGERFRHPFDAQRTLHSHVPIPPEWEHVEKRILNRFFVDYRSVEKAVGNGITLFDRVRKYALETEVAKQHGEEEKLSFTDAEMQEKIQAICQYEYHVNSHHQLDGKTLLLLARTLANRFASPVKQITRLLGVDPDLLNRIL